MEDYHKNVFINCPFDRDYRQLLLVLIFTVTYLGFTPRLALERSDSGESRITKILKMIRESKFGIHDISRIVSSSANEYYRMNIPFELGVDYACQNLLKEPHVSCARMRIISNNPIASTPSRSGYLSSPL